VGAIKGHGILASASFRAKIHLGNTGSLRRAGRGCGLIVRGNSRHERHLNELDSMQLEANSALQAQISTLPPNDRLRTQSALARLAENPNSSSPTKRRLSSSDPGLWEVKIGPQLRALVRIEHEKVILLAVARKDEIKRYLQAGLGD
jgi:mRNA-degrading endonuclease RelE of RelBE toxin-antitoxin system